MAATLRWFLRLFALLAMLLFGTLMVIFIAVTVDRFGEKQYVTDRVGGLPPVYVITAVLVPFCLLFTLGFAWMFYDSFRSHEPPDDDFDTPAGPLPPAPPTVWERMGGWARGHRPQLPERLRGAGD